ncbi:AraC family transcriptional regulator [Clostridium neuense]
MNYSLKEEKSHGTSLYPFQIYYMNDNTTKVFVLHHWHNYVEIIYVQAGRLFININNEQYAGTSGDIFIVNEEELHGMYTEDTCTLYYAFLFPLKFLNFEMNDLVQNSYLGALCNKNSIFENKIPITSESYEKILHELKTLIHLNEAKENEYQFATKISLLNIVYLLAKGKLIKERNSSLSIVKDNKLNLLKNITSYIHENYNRRIYLETISEKFNMSPKYFCKFFKDNFGKTFIEYVNGLRIDKSMDMLINTDLPIMDIAFANGFENFSYYIRAFKKLVGYTPLSYRKKSTQAD